MTPDEIRATIHGKEYALTPITIGDLRAFHAKLLGERLVSVQFVIKSMPEAERIKLLTSIINTPITQQTITEGMTSLDGMTYFLYRAMLKHQPGVTLDWLYATLTTADVMEIVPVVMRLMRREDPTPAPTEKAAA